MLRRKRKRRRRRGSAFFCRRKTKRGTGTSRNVAAVVSPGKSDGILTGRPLVDLVPSSLPLSPPSKKGRECQSYIRELLGTPNKLAEHVSQNRGYLGTSNPLRIRLHLALSSPPSFLASPSLPRLFIALFVSGFVISFPFFRRSFTSLNCSFSAAAIIRQCVSTRPRKRRE